MQSVPMTAIGVQTGSSVPGEESAETTKQLEEKAKDLVVTDGWVTLSLTHCSSYVLAEPAPASTPEDSTMLYIGIGAAAAAILGAVAFFIIRRR